jgi:hypothetical protein
MSPKKVRVKPARDAETQLLIDSRRRCLFCFGIRGDFGEKKGQIAHIDGDRSNSANENLAFLCMDHHDQYDSKTSTSKSLKRNELRTYRKVLYEFIKKGGLVPPAKLIRPKRQAKVNTAISLELFDRRIKFYESAKMLIITVIQKADIKTDECLRFARETDLALFYFDEGIVQYFRELYRKAVQISCQNESLRNEFAPPAERTKANEESTETLNWFSVQLEALQKVLQPFLRLD